MKKGYKLVVAYKRKLYSIVACVEAVELNKTAKDNDFVCTYVKGKETLRPNGFGPLAVFSNLKSAKEYKPIMEENIKSMFENTKPKNTGFKDIKLKVKIFKIQYKESNEKELYLSFKNQTYIYRKNLEELPMGTKLADSVILLEEVK